MIKISGIILLLLMIPALEVIADSGGEKLERFRALLDDGSRVEGKNGLLTGTALEWTSSDGMRKSLSRDSVRFLDHCVGSHAGTGAIIGAGVGLLSVYMGYWAAKADAAAESKDIDDSGILPVVAGVTVGCAIVGMIYGSTLKKWERIPLETGVRIDPDFKGGGKLVLTCSF